MVATGGRHREETLCTAAREHSALLLRQLRESLLQTVAGVIGQDLVRGGHGLSISNAMVKHTSSQIHESSTSIFPLAPLAGRSYVKPRPVGRG